MILGSFRDYFRQLFRFCVVKAKWGGEVVFQVKRVANGIGKKKTDLL